VVPNVSLGRLLCRFTGRRTRPQSLGCGNGAFYRIGRIGLLSGPIKPNALRSQTINRITTTMFKMLFTVDCIGT
jgi:hypothetical protein